MTNRTFGRPLRRLFYLLMLTLPVGVPSWLDATGPTMTTIADVVYRANGQPASGTIVVSWPAFNTADNKPVAAGVLSIVIGAEGTVNFALVPNEGGDPGGTFYKAVYKLADGTTFTEYWVVPSNSPSTIAAIRASVVPRQVGAQFVNRQYVDTAVATTNAQVVHKSGSEAIEGVKSFAASPEVPAPASGVAAVNQDYVTSAISAVTEGYVDKSGDTMSGPLTIPDDPVAAGHATNRHYVDLQVADILTGLDQKLGRSGDTPVRLAEIRFADQFPGANPGAKMDSACADLGGSPGLVVIPSSMAAGNGTVGDNCRLLDLRAAVGPNAQGSEGQAYGKDLILRARWTAAPLTAQNYQTLHAHAEAFAGGINNPNGPKTNYGVIYATMTNRTKGQHTAYQADNYNFSSGDTQGAGLTATSWGSRSAAGDEGTVAVRANVGQGGEVMTGTVASANGNTITLVSNSPGTRFLGEGRPLINTGAAATYSTGTVSGIAGTPPTVTGSGTAWATQFGAGAKTNLFFSLDSETNGALKYVVPIASIANETTLVLEYVDQSSSKPWSGAGSSGTYKIFKGSNVTGMSANVGDTSPVSPSITVADGTQFAAADTVEQPLGYGTHLVGVKIVMNNYLPSPTNTNQAIEAGLIAGSRPAFSTLGWNGEITGPLMYFSGLGTTYRPSHLIKVASGNSPAVWLSMQDSVNSSFHEIFQLFKNSGVWRLTYNKADDVLKFSDQTTVTVKPTADNASEFNVTGSTGIPHFQVGSVNTFLNNGANLKGYSDNAITEQWSIAGGTGSAAFKAAAIEGSVTAGSVTTSANGGLDVISGTGAGLTPAAGHTVLWSDSTANRLKVNDNNGGATTLAKFTDNLGVFAATTSAQLLGVISDEVGTGTKVAKFNSVSGNSGIAAQSSGTLTSGNCAKFDANGNLVDHGAACGGGGGATLDVNAAGFDEEFLGNAVTSNLIGVYGWGLFNVGGGTATTSFQVQDIINPAAIRLSTGSATTNHGGVLSFGNNNNQGFFQLGSTTIVTDSHFRAKLVAGTNNVDIRFGYLDPGTYAVAPTNFIGVRCATTLSDANFMLEVRTGGTPVTIDTTVACDTAYHRLRVRTDGTSGKIFMTFYNATGTISLAEKSFCPSGCDATVTLPTQKLMPGFILGNSGAAGTARTADIDMWKAAIQGLSR
jgi:hypothetical protein